MGRVRVVQMLIRSDARLKTFPKDRREMPQTCKKL